MALSWVGSTLIRFFPDGALPRCKSTLQFVANTVLPKNASPNTVPPLHGYILIFPYHHAGLRIDH